MAAMLVSQTNPLGVELFSLYANAIFSSNKFAQMLATLVKTLYTDLNYIVNISKTFLVKGLNPGVISKDWVDRPAERSPE